MENLSKLIELTKSANASNIDFENRLYVSSENARKTIFLADLPRTTSYLDLSEFFEQ
jgi:hypothetical protein